ncbi:tol-pal system protein YbgF [Rhodoferax sp. GW822-FHT02A01]|uniref:tol-pal system protein YbgF n=1 Tax=Rhodoferax sp. GW822-FHT02A01 TaxID=3141537 RepID=UPI00315DA6E9
MLANRPLISRFCALACMLVMASSASAGLFDDEEARRAILDLRQRLEAVKQEKADTDRKIADETQRASDEAAQLRRSILDLQNQLETARGDMAKLRGQNEQLARDVSEFQRKQKDANAGLEDRLRKFEPQTVSVDGREFLADPAEKRDYEATLALFRKGDFANSGSGFVDFLNKYPQSGYRPSALFWLGNAQYATKDCKSAIVNFRSLISQTPDHVHVPEARLTIANCQLEAKDTKGAKKTLEELIAAHPSTDAANAAKDRLSRMK